MRGWRLPHARPFGPACNLAVMRMLTDIAKAGTTVVMVTHSHAHAAYAQRTIKLLDGRVVSETLLAA